MSSAPSWYVTRINTRVFRNQRSRGSLDEALSSAMLASSLEVLGEVLVHLEHGDAVFAEHGLELVVGHDLALVLRVLELVALDVVPNLAHHLGAGQRV